MQGRTDTLLLASTSRWRRNLLQSAGVRCDVAEPGVDEAVVAPEPPGGPVGLARARARAKARAVADGAKGRLVLGADQVAHLDGECFGKPRDDEDWLARLRFLRGRTHLLTTAVALVSGGVERVFEVTTGVRFRADLSDDELAAYVSLGEARGCAGGYMIEGRGAWLVEGIEGDWLNVVGLPVLQVIGELRRLGWRMDGGQS